MLHKIIRYFLDNKLVTLIIILLLVGWGLVTAPFDREDTFLDISWLPSDLVPVDAIPDIGENQQIVFTKWTGRSPQDIDDQITYPLTTTLMGIPGVKSVRSSSIFGVSSIYIIFDEDIEFYWSRSRILEKLNSLPSGLLPDDVQPVLGPDATALGQVFWYTLEGRDPKGNPTGGWDLHEIRTVQDFYVKYGLNAVEGVSEVASIGGYVQEYQIDVNPDALKAYGIPLHKVMLAVKQSNRDVGAKTLEINQAEYLVRGLGYVKSIADIEKAVVSVNDNVPILIRDIGVVSLGPASRRGLLDKGGAEVVGGVVIARYGANPLSVINQVKDKIGEISDGLPVKTLDNGVVSKLTIVPFYDRTQLINETLGTLKEALSLEILITILVVILMVFNLRASMLISSLLPIAILIVFIAMRYFGVDANIVALSGIAIAIGTMVDLGIVLSENILKKIKEQNAESENRLSEAGVDVVADQPSGIAHTGGITYYQKIKESVYEASAEVSSAIITAVATTIVSFVPVFTMEAAEGKLFRPLAFTKTFALIAALIVSLIILPTIAHWVFGIRLFKKSNLGSKTIETNSADQSVFKSILSKTWQQKHILIATICATYLLARFWMPLGVNQSLLMNLIFVVLIVGLILGAFTLLEYFYENILSFFLRYKWLFMLLPLAIIYCGYTIWQNTGKEFMPSLNEGSFLLMPTSMPHAGMEQNKKVVQQLDMLVANIPEVDLVVGKMGRAETALDPAPISMYENIINYKPEYAIDANGNRQRFRTDDDGFFVLHSGKVITNENALQQRISTGDLIVDEEGSFFRNWRESIHSPDDIWNEIVRVTKIPGVTSAPKLQPIETRLVMLQTGMRAPIGIKVYGPDLQTIEDFGRELESILKKVPSVKSEAVFADRIVGKPYIHLNINRDQISRYGLSIEDVQQTIETAIGGMQITSTVEGRKRFPVRVRYPRELRDDPAALSRILIPTPTGVQVPLGELVAVEYLKGPQMIKSENTFLTGYVLLDKKDGFAELDVVNDAKASIQKKIDTGELSVPEGVSYRFSGNYENQVRAEKKLTVIIPLVLIIIFLILYFQFKSITTVLMIFMGITMAFSGAFVMMWLYGQDWFLDFSFLGANLRSLFQMHPINLSVAVWVGFIALFGIATDDGVLMGTYLDQSFIKNPINNREDIRAAVIKAARRRIKPAVMTSATTIIALLPILTSTGRGSDIMIPMAIPAFGGMIAASVTYFIVPVLYAAREEFKIKNMKS